MFEGTMSHNPVRVSLPATCAGSETLLLLAQREYYFGFYFFPYAPVVGRWSA
jgi:hypothetical protein